MKDTRTALEKFMEREEKKIVEAEKRINTLYPPIKITQDGRLLVSPSASFVYRTATPEDLESYAYAVVYHNYSYTPPPDKAKEFKRWIQAYKNRKANEERQHAKKHEESEKAHEARKSDLIWRLAYALKDRKTNHDGLLKIKSEFGIDKISDTYPEIEKLVYKRGLPLTEADVTYLATWILRNTPRAPAPQPQNKGIIQNLKETLKLGKRD